MDEMAAPDTRVTIWCYVITHDAGAAPNFERPSATLAICKPKIRKGAEVGHLVVAFAGKPLGLTPDTVIWAGEVSETIELGDYWNDRRFMSKKPVRSKRPDNIYKP